MSDDEEGWDYLEKVYWYAEQQRQEEQELEAEGLLEIGSW